MLNVVVPMVGASHFFDESDYKYPKPLIEINGKTMIELFLENYSSISKKVNFIFIVNEEDCRKYHLDNVLNILTNYSAKIVKVSKPTKGAACSVLMAIKHISGEVPLIIANPDQVFDVDLDTVLDMFDSTESGAITFNSIHPRWSYVRLDQNGFVIETAEKKPISNKAIAGFYYFASGDVFINATFSMIKKDASVDGQFYIAPIFNELVLENKSIKTFHVDTENYHTFYTPQKITEYERIAKCH